MKMVLAVACALLALTSSIAPAMAQEETAYFRLGVNGVAVIENPGEDNETPPPGGTNSQWSIVYPPTAVTAGQHVSIAPTGFEGEPPDGWTVTGSGTYSGMRDPDTNAPLPLPAGLDIDPSTGVISGVPEDSGVIRAMVILELPILVDDGSGQPYPAYTNVGGFADITITNSAYTINVTPSHDLTVRLGTTSVPQSIFTATTNPPQPPSGEEWGIHAAARPSWNQVLSGPTFTLDPVDDFGWEYQFFSFYRKDAEGNKTSSAPVVYRVYQAPYYGPQDEGDGVTHVVGWDDDVSSNVLQIKQGVSFSVAMYADYGATSSPTTWPSNTIPPVPPQGTLPPGVSIASNGVISGTTTAAVGSTFAFIVPAKSDANAYGYAPWVAKVVDEFTEPGGGDPGGEDPEYLCWAVNEYDPSHWVLVENPNGSGPCGLIVVDPDEEDTYGNKIGGYIPELPDPLWPDPDFAWNVFLDPRDCSPIYDPALMLGEGSSPTPGGSPYVPENWGGEPGYKQCDWDDDDGDGGQVFLVTDGDGYWMRDHCECTDLGH